MKQRRGAITLELMKDASNESLGILRRHIPTLGQQFGCYPFPFQRCFVGYGFDPIRNAPYILKPFNCRLAGVPICRHNPAYPPYRVTSDSKCNSAYYVSSQYGPKHELHKCLQR